MNSYFKSTVLCSIVLAISAGIVFAGCGACGPAPAKKKACPTACGKCPVEAAKTEELATIETHALEKLIASGAKVTILDARSGKWDDGRRIPGAKSLAPDASANEAKKLIKSKDSLVITYCTSPKCGASPALSKNLTKLGYKNVIEYPAGINGWEEHGNKIEKTK